MDVNGRQRGTSRWVGGASVVVLGLVALGAAACSSGVPTPSDPVLAQGQTIYNAKCVQCHGDKGQGGTGMKLGGGRAKAVFPNIDDQIAVIAEGRQGTSMPGWKNQLTPDEMKAVARYERETLPGS